MRIAPSLILLGICGCGSNPPPPQNPQKPDTKSDTLVADVSQPKPPKPPTKPGDPCGEPAPASTEPMELPDPNFAVPEKFAPQQFGVPWRKVAVGQTISFSTAAIDQDLDETAVYVIAKPESATFDPITQTVTWTPTKSDMPKGKFTLKLAQPARQKEITTSFTIDVVNGKPVPAPTAPVQKPVIETLLMIRQPARLAQVNEDWPLDKLLLVGADAFKLQIPADRRAGIGPLDAKTLYEGMLTGLAQTHLNPRLDPKSPKFDRAAFGDPKSWKIVAFRPRIDKAWTELRVVYRAMNVHEPVFAMFRLRPVVEYVPALPRPEEEREANNKIFLGMVTKHLFEGGAPNPKFVKDEVAHGKAVSALMTELMTFDDTKNKPYLHGFEIGIALEARMGGGSARDIDGSYRSGDGWGWNAMKPFITADGKSQQYVNVAIPGFWTATQPSKDGTTWVPKCATRFNAADPAHVPGYEALCRKTMGFVDLPDVKDGRIINGKRDANNLYLQYKKQWMVTDNFALEDGRRDLGEENGMTCSQCHIRNFGMHDYGDPANTDPRAGTPKALNHTIETLNFQIIPEAKWEAFTLEFLSHQECRGKMLIEQYLGPDAAKGLTCPLAK